VRLPSRFGQCGLQRRYLIIAYCPSDFALNEWFRFPSGDSEVLAARIDALLSDTAWRTSAGQAYAVKAKDYDFEASAHKLMNVYRELAAAPALAA